MNKVCESLHKMTGTEQRMPSSYHPQSNGLCEQQNRTIKDALVKVLDENACDWPYVIEGVLFAHRVSKHTSTKFSPFFLLYNREPNLPIDIKHDIVWNAYKMHSHCFFIIYNLIFKYRFCDFFSGHTML